MLAFDSYLFGIINLARFLIDIRLSLGHAWLY